MLRGSADSERSAQKVTSYQLLNMPFEEPELIVLFNSGAPNIKEIESSHVVLLTSLAANLNKLKMGL